MTQSLHQIIEAAKEELKDNFKGAQYPTDIIHEIADNSVPVYNYDLLKLACEDLSLGCDEPEFYAFDGKKTAVNAIAANVYQKISSELFQYLLELQDEDYREAA